MTDEMKQSKIFERMKKSEVLKDENVNFIFNNLRNAGLSTLPVIAASSYLKSKHIDSDSLFLLIVVFSASTSILLLLLNILHAWRKIAELHLPLWLRGVMAIFVYFAISTGYQLLLYAKQ